MEAIRIDTDVLIRFSLILIIGFAFIKLFIRFISRSKVNKKIDPTIGSFLIGLIKFILYAAYIIVLLSSVGVPMTTFVAMLSAIGLAIALALQGNLSNFSSALVILFFKPFKVGDFIETGSHMGTIQEIELLFTYILTPDNRRISVPNSELVNSRVINYSSENNRRIDLIYGVSYKSDIEKVKKLINQVIESNDCILKEPEPIVRLFNHGVHALEFDVKIWVKREDFWSVKYYMNEEILNCFRKFDIDIPFPQQEIWLNKPNFVEKEGDDD